MLLEKLKIATIYFRQRNIMYKKVLTPRISEENRARHIGHQVIPIWLEEGFIEIIRLFNPDLKADPEIIMKIIHMEFINEIFFGVDVEVITGVKKIGNTSLVLNQKIYQGGRLCVKGTSTWVSFDFNSKKSRAIPPHVRQMLEEHMMTD
jgi:acyl-CoA thioester hydrolase